MKKNRDIDFLYEVGSLRYVERRWRQLSGMEMATNLEHTVRVALIALIIAKREGVKNEEKVMKMALLHDLPETRVTDHAHVHRDYVVENDSKASKDLFSDTTLSDLEETVLKEYKERKSIEAKIVKDADNLDIDLELKELTERGSTLEKALAHNRKKVRNEKLYTKTAQKLWDEIYKSNPHSWHDKANKWLNKPQAGK
jgi:putative hydrolase of HD superfamily